MSRLLLFCSLKPVQSSWMKCCFYKKGGTGDTSLSLRVCVRFDDWALKAWSRNWLSLSKFLSLFLFTQRKASFSLLKRSWMISINLIIWLATTFFFFKLFFLQIITYIFKIWLIIRYVHHQMHNLRWNICDIQIEISWQIIGKCRHMQMIFGSWIKSHDGKQWLRTMFVDLLKLFVSESETLANMVYIWLRVVSHSVTDPVWGLNIHFEAS